MKPQLHGLAQDVRRTALELARSLTKAETQLARLPELMQHGEITATSTAGSRVTVTFPVPFASAPTVVATRRSSTNNQIVAHVFSVSATEVIFVVTSNDATQPSVSNIVINWIAVGNPA